uniref:(northern house mosquito) hypothetical protein n=1 Tax=Culex pipiens TaxID=7175 RepID=A0A8D8N7M2_CULPI
MQRATLFHARSKRSITYNHKSRPCCGCRFFLSVSSDTDKFSFPFHRSSSPPLCWKSFIFITSFSLKAFFPLNFPLPSQHTQLSSYSLTSVEKCTKFLLITPPAGRRIAGIPRTSETPNRTVPNFSCN